MTSLSFPLRALRPASAGPVALSVLALLLAGCGGGRAAAGDERTLTVFAAASLTGPFGELEERFEDAHPGVDVRLSLNGSSDLATQIEEGAPADVFASADTATMDRLGDLATGPRTFATNTLEIATRPGNPEGVTGFEDLADPGLQVVVCAAPVPCGTATEHLEEVTGVGLDPVSREQSVTDVLGKVTSGQADAGVVYRSDVASAGDAVQGVGIERAGEVVNAYPVSVLDGAADPALAQEFVDLVLSAQGQRVLSDAGFGAP